MLNSRSPFVGSRFLALLTLASAFVIPAIAQDTPPAPDVATNEAAAEKPIVPDTKFPTLIALDSSDAVWTLGVSHGGRLRAKGDVAVNSVNRGALWLADANIQITGGTLSVVGGESRLGRNSVSPAPLLGGAGAEDPMPEFRIPAPRRVISATKLFLSSQEEGVETTMQPGIYNGGIFATGSGHILMQPGIYIINNGDFSAIGPTIEGKDVTIVMAGNEAGSLSFSLGARLFLSAPTQGKMKGLAIVSRAQKTKSVSFASASGQVSGLIYAPECGLSVNNGELQTGKVICLSVAVGSKAVLDLSGDLEPFAEADTNQNVMAPATTEF